MIEDATISVVDDDGSVRKALTRMFRSLGWRASAFASGDEFLEAELSKPACLILDVRMPGISGLELQRELRVRSIDLPVVFMTAHAEIQTCVKAMKAGAVDFLIKPVAESTLVETVRQALEERALDP
ncbi:MAG: response regulator transcription factor [Verrucomicrobiales bacterium]